MPGCIFLTLAESIRYSHSFVLTAGEIGGDHFIIFYLTNAIVDRSFHPFHSIKQRITDNKSRTRIAINFSFVFS